MFWERLLDSSISFPRGKCLGFAAFSKSNIIFDPFNSSPPCFVAIIGSSCITSSHVSVAMPYGPVVCILQTEEQNNWNAVIQILPRKQSVWLAHILSGTQLHQIAVLKYFLTEDMKESHRVWKLGLDLRKCRSTFGKKTTTKTNVLHPAPQKHKQSKQPVTGNMTTIMFSR